MYVCIQTQLYQLRCFNDYTRQLHVSAPTGLYIACAHIILYILVVRP